jgi:hypothetical protein
MYKFRKSRKRLRVIHTHVPKNATRESTYWVTPKSLGGLLWIRRPDMLPWLSVDGTVTSWERIWVD